jgi:hypothetical protein
MIITHIIGVVEMGMNIYIHIWNKREKWTVEKLKVIVDTC